MAETEQILDVTKIAPPKKHSTIFQTFDELNPGDAFIIKNDHDPRPLKFQFKFEREGQFEWDYLQEGPEKWRVRISKIISYK
ncbi:DUF2249 domain-containing protein [Rhodohalobacter halophilus]|uniref:DUF2249 domain-containing protein n=1 Tax=Rhodohalobacter halophilus TaxID=1812810 RepID=UPI00083F742B|nr:DUF2249 domain-containing protein [Rhodohalobacter halophilus]